MVRIIAAILFGFGFGLAFVYIGVRRIILARREANPAEAVLWGAIGVLLGVAVVAGLTWFLVSAMNATDGPPGPLVPYPDRYPDP